jgi:leader peptidase (prepilin peptidase)/N-methyltransferase
MAAALLDASLIGLCAVVTVADVRTRLVPDRALVAALLVGLAVIAVDDPASLSARMLAALTAGGFLLVGALIRPDGMGLGDVKLAGVLGLYLGEAVIVALLVAFAAGSLAGLALLFRHGWEARSRTIPFAPFLALGAIASLTAQP